MKKHERKMNTGIVHRLIAWTLSLVMVLGLLPVGIPAPVMAAETDSAADVQYTAMSHNIFAGMYGENDNIAPAEGEAWKIPLERYKKLYAVLQAEMPDVVAFQECDWLWHDDLLDNVTGNGESLGVQPVTALGYGYAAGDDKYISNNRNPLYYNTAKLSLVADGWHAYNASEAQTETPWCVTWAVFAAKDSDVPLFAASSTHIVSNVTAEDRAAMINWVVTVMKDIESQYGVPLVMMGDWNTSPSVDGVDYAAFALGEKLLSSRSSAAVVTGREYQTHNTLGNAPAPVGQGGAGVIDHIMISTSGVIADKYENMSHLCDYSDHVPQRLTFHLDSAHTHSFSGEVTAEAGNYESHAYFCECGMADRQAHSWIINEADQTVCSVCNVEMPESVGKLGCYCAGNGTEDHVCENLTWTAWNSGDSVPYAAGNYYLTQDIVVSGPCWPTADATIRLDLNGHTVTANGTKLYNMGVYGGVNLTITDRSAGKNGAMISAGTYDGALGMLMEIKKGNVVNLYAGTLDGSGLTSNTPYGVTLTMTDSGTTFNQYGGTVIGGTVTGGQGGTLWMASGTTYNMHGGLMKDGKANSDGGNVMIQGGATFNLHDGTVSGGIANYNGGDATKCGGNFQVLGTLNMYGGIIENGTVAAGGSMGGNVSVGYGTFNMTGGIIRGGSCALWGGSNIRVNSGTFKMTGGLVDGTNANSSSVFGDGNPSNIIVGGTAKIKNAARNIAFSQTSSVVTVESTLVTSGEDAAEIWVNMAEGKVFVTSGATKEMEKVFHVDGSPANNMGVVYSNGTLTVKNMLTTGCYCAGNGTEDHVCEELAWTAWTKTNSLPESTGNYYLTEDVTIGWMHYLSDNDQKINLDLNGHTVTTGCKTLFMNHFSGLEYTITDRSAAQNGKIVATGAFTGGEHGLFAHIGKGNILNLYAGTIDGSGLSSNSDYGVVLTLVDGGQYNQYGGTLVGATSTTGPGAAIWMASGTTCNLYGGTIRDGKAMKDGGNVFISAGATFNMKGGTVSGGVAAYNGTAGNNCCGGNFQVNGVLNMSGGIIENGSIDANGSMGGNVSVGSGTFNMTGGIIRGGSCAKWGGSNIRVNSGTFKMTGGLVDGTNANSSSVFGDGNPSNIIVGGTAKIKNASQNIILNNASSYIGVEGLVTSGNDTAEIWVSANGGRTLVSSGANADMVNVFHLDNEVDTCKLFCVGDRLLTSSVTAVVDGETVCFATIADAVAEGVDTVKLSGNWSNDTVTADLILDLNGKSFTDAVIADGVTVQLIDSTTDDFEGTYGYMSGTVNGNVKTLVKANGKNYLVVCQDNQYSAHCFEMKLAYVTLDAAKDALGYKAQFAGDEVVCANVTAYGFNMGVSIQKTFSKEEQLTNGQMVTLRLHSILAANSGEKNITASTFVSFGNAVYTSEVYTTTMKQTLQRINAAWNTYSQAQQTAVKALCDDYEITKSWELNNIYPA